MVPWYLILIFLVIGFIAGFYVARANDKKLDALTDKVIDKVSSLKQ